MPARRSIPESVWWLAMALALAGCSDLGNKVRLRALGEVTATSLDFGTLALNAAATRTVTVRNAGNADLVGNATVSCGAFELTAGGGPFTLGPGQALDLVVRFEPIIASTFSCTLDLGPGNPQVALTGAGALQPPGAAWSVVPSSLEFGVIAAGQSSFRTFRIRSTGSVPLTVNVVSPCAEYLPVTGGGAAVIPPGDSVGVNVLFNPLSGGAFPCVIAVGPGIPGVSVTGIATTVSFANDIQPIFNGSCVGCHGFNGGLALNAGSSYANLVGVRSFGYAPALRVVPFDTTSSVLYVKLTKPGVFGGGMPQIGYPLARTMIDKVKAWILEGARSN